MSFRTTTLLFGVLLAVLWVFGLTLALRRSSLDSGLVFPNFAKSEKAAINEVEILKDGKTYTFNKTDQGWRLKLPGAKEAVRVEDSRINELVDQIRAARHSNEETDINRNLTMWGLDNPWLIVVLRDTALDSTMTLKVGSLSEDKAFVRVNSSDRPRDVLAVKKSLLSSLFFNKINDFRVPRLIDATDTTTVAVDLTEQREGKVVQELSLFKKDNSWRFKKPNLGPADYEGLSKGKEQTGVNALLLAIIGLRAEEFEPPDVTLPEKSARLRIAIEYETGKPGQKGNERKKDILLIGEEVAGQPKGKEQYFARLEGDNSVVRVDASRLEPVFAAVKDPAPLRSHDLAQFNPDSVDAIFIERGAEFAKLYLVDAGKKPKKFHPQQPPQEEPESDKGWKVFSSATTPRAGNSKAITDGLLGALQGKREITDKDFLDSDTPDKLKALEEKFAKGKVKAKVQIYSDALEEKKDEAKDKKTEEKGEQKKDKQDEQKDKKKAVPDVPPKFKADAKPVLTLTFVQDPDPKAPDLVLVKREALDTEPMFFKLRFTTYEKIEEKVVPPNLALAFFDPEIKPFAASDAIKITLVRNIDKVKDTFVLEREILKDKEKEKDPKDKTDAKDKDQKQDKKDEGPKYGFDWKLKEPKDFAGKAEADDSEVNRVLFTLAGLQAKRWVTKATKESLDNYVLDAPRITVTVELKGKDGDKDKPKPFVLMIGRKSGVENDKEAYYALLKDADLVFVVDKNIEQLLKDVEFRDRTVMKFDAARIKELTVKLLVSEESSQLAPVFERGGDKGWKVKAGVTKLDLDPKKVNALLDKVADLKVLRYLNVKMPAPKEYRLEEKADIAYKPKLVVVALVERDCSYFGTVVGKTTTTHTLRVGAPQDPQDKESPLYGWCDDLPNVVFLVKRAEFESAMKLKYYSKETD